MAATARRASRPVSVPDGLARNAGIAATVVLVTSGAGWLIGRGDAGVVVAAGILAGFWTAASLAPAPTAALLVLVVCNGVPIVELNQRLPGGLKVQDLAVLGLAGLLLLNQRRPQGQRLGRIARAASLWAGLFLAWWVVTTARSVLLYDIPLLKAVLFGRDFAYFGILLPLAARAHFPARSLRTAGWVLLGGTIACAVAQDIQSATGVSLSWLAHPAIVDRSTTASVGNTTGITRLYSSMFYPINTFLVFAAALVLAGRIRRRRWIVIGIAAILFADALLGLARANYFALGAALLAGIAFYAVRYRRDKVIVRLGIAAALVGVLATGLASDIQLSSVPVVRGVVTRATSGISALQQSSGTVAYRENVDGQMLRLLGGRWPIGLGFLHPAARYFDSLPGGTIRNSDTGVFNALTTMGAIGVLLLALPFAYGARELVRAGRPGAPSRAPAPWIVCGAAAWIAWALAGSPTLGVLFSVPGLVVSALTLGALVHAVSAQSPALVSPSLPETAEALLAA